MRESLSTLLGHWAETRPDAPAVIFLPDGESESGRMTYADMSRAVHRLGAAMTPLITPGDRVVLLYPPSLEFVGSMMACMTSGAIAVPLAPARRRQSSAHVAGILRDADPSVVVTIRDLVPALEDALAEDPSIARPAIIVADEIPGDASGDWTPHPAKPDDLALLQYTSGSTGRPKGVALTHGNLLANQAMIRHAFDSDNSEAGVSWLPQYHDMGLIGDTIQAIYHGAPRVFMPPQAFIERPIRWLRLISQFDNVTSGGPDFAYDYCVRRITDEQCAELDLSGWRIAYSGSEPVRADTLDRFCEKFGPCGFDPDAILPCFGMAETSLLVTGGPGRGTRTEVAVDPDALGKGRVTPAAGGKRFVGCGAIAPKTTVHIVDPDTGVPCADDAVGEIWINSPSVGVGYWRREAETERTFHARLAGDDKTYLRTGDLGFLRDGQLFIVGRMSDKIILRGRNFYPHDIERTVQDAHPALELHAGAAFAVERDGRETLVVVQEVRRSHRRGADVAAIGSAVRQAISREHGVTLSELVVTGPGSILKTTSGKIRRGAMRELLLAGDITPLGRKEGGRPPSTMPKTIPEKTPEESHPPVDVNELLAWLRDYADRRVNSRLMDERKCIPPYIILDMGNRGILGIRGPRALGGLALNHRDTMRVFEQLGAIDQSLALFVGLHNVLGTGPIAAAARADNRDELLARLVPGRELGAFALTEPGAGSDPRAIRARAVPDGPGRWKLHGTKFWSGVAAWSGVINVFAKLEGSDGGGLGTVAFAVRQGTPGLRHGVEAPTMGMRAIVQNTVHLEGVEVTERDMLGGPGDGLHIAQEAMMYGRLAIASACLGGMRRCAQLMHRYASRRMIGGERLAHNPVTLERLDATTGAIAGLDALVTRLAGMLDADEKIPDEIYAAVKILAPELCWEAADRLCQMLGGRGYIETNVAPQMLRDARVLRVFEGPTEAMCAYLGARLVNDTSVVLGFIENDLKAPEAAGVLRDVLDRMHGPLHEGDIATRALLRFRLGDAAAWAVFAGGLESHGAAPARRWAATQLRARIDVVTTPPADISHDIVAADIAGYIDRIGDTEQSMVGEDTALDPLLRREEGPASGDAGVVLPEATDTAPAPSRPVGGVTRTVTEIEAFLRAWVAERLELRPEDVDSRAPFAELGADSVTAVELVMDLGDYVGQTLDDTLPWEAPNIAAVAERLGTSSSVPRAPAASPPGSVKEPKPVASDDGLVDIEVSLRRLEQRLGGS